MLIPPSLRGEANASGGVTEREIDDTLWVAVKPPVIG
jgi:hypothetical protein